MTRIKRYRVGIAVVIVLGLTFSEAVVRSAESGGEVPWENAFQNTARSFVTINYHLQKSERPRIGGDDGYNYEQSVVLPRVLGKNTLDVIGVIISDKGDVLTFEEEPPFDDVVSRITVTGWDGAVVPAQADRVLIRTPGRVLRLAGALPAKWQALAFTEIGDVTPQTKLYAATMKMDERGRISIQPCGYSRDWNDAGQSRPSLSVPGVACVGVLCDEQGRPVGATTQRQIDLGSDGPVWRGKDILADAGISADERSRLEERLERDFARNIYEVKITFRPEPEEEEDGGFGGGYPFGGGYRRGRDDGREQVMYGLGFAADKVLIPTALSQEMIAGMDEITVNIGDTYVPARFAGVLKQCSAMVMELQNGTLPQTVAFETDGEVARIEPFWTVFARELAGMDVLVEYSRWIEKQQGYADIWNAVSERPILLGSWLLDRRGRLVGLFARARHEHDRLRPYLSGQNYERYQSFRTSANQVGRSTGASGSMLRYGYHDNARLFAATELAGMLGDLPANYDGQVRHLSKDDQKRRVWLGVEYTAPSKEMVKQMNLRRPTRDGRLGLMINRIYPGSPAVDLGLAEGDILLKITLEDMPWPIELVASERENYDMPDFGEGDVPQEFEAMGLRMPRRRPWPSRDNYLTRLLGDIGVGTSITLSYLHNGDSVEKDLVIAQAPRDMLSAAKYKNDKLGLTVKDLTYEIRAALRISPDDPAVVVTQVEQGTPAALARINPYELIRAVDGEQVASAEIFEDRVTKALEARKESVRLTVEWMGKTRLADLKFEAKGTPGLLRSLLPGLQ